MLYILCIGFEGYFSYLFLSVHFLIIYVVPCTFMLIWRIKLIILGIGYDFCSFNLEMKILPSLMWFAEECGIIVINLFMVIMAY